MRRQRIAAWALLMVLYFEMAGDVYARTHRYTFLPENTSFQNFSTKSIRKNDTPNNPEVGQRDIIDVPVEGYFSEQFSGGPGQPEMSSFKSVNADNMVNLFTGDFSYNIPLMDVGGYPVNLFYQGGIGIEQEATWVGLGWNINPGSISRNMRGLPDDFDGTENITKTQSIKTDKTYGVSGSGGVEVFGFGKLQLQGGMFYNNYKGFGLEAGGSAAVKLNLGKKASDEKTAAEFPKFDDNTSPTLGIGGFNLNSQEGFSLQPKLSVRIFQTEAGATTGYYGASIGTSYNSRYGFTGMQIDAELSRYNKALFRLYPGLESSHPLSVPISFAKPSYLPSIRMPLTRTNLSVEYKTGLETYGAHPHLALKGYYTEASIKSSDQVQSKPAFGYLYMEKANENRNALLDFNRINDNVYTPKTPMISLPNYTYDVFSINGEGTGGSFRAYRGNIGFVRDPYTKTKSNNDALGIEIGTGASYHGGAELDYVTTATSVYKWRSNNTAESSLAFKANDGDKQMVYFKNPGEKAIVSKDYYDAVGGDKLVRLKFSNSLTRKPIALPAFEVFESNRTKSNEKSLTNAVRNVRDKRTQVISYLTAAEAQRIGLDKDIRSYPINDFNVVNCENYRIIRRASENRFKEIYRKPNHISEITVLEPDGKRYVYGVPVYTTYQKEVTFSVDASQPAQDGLVGYYPGQNSVANKEGSDNFFQSEETPAYAHSFLLSALLSPDYVDVKGDGITDDDLGDAVKFNYSRIEYQDGQTGPSGFINYKWRTPFDPSGFNNSYPSKAILNEGLKTEKGDNKASYTYGEREMWYMHSIESKNMIAVFVLGDRKDNLQPDGENGGGSPTSTLRKLERIDLYVKSELVTNGFTGANKAKPIKSVVFSYSYKLCKKFPLNVESDKGKLTLDSLWFTYNGNQSQRRNIYRFDYTNNPDYKKSSQDNWGNYKTANINPAQLSNQDFPYVSLGNNTTNRSQLDEFAGAWMLNRILLPSGSQINVEFEADDYGFVQNRRSCQMFQIAGFGKDASQGYTPSNRLFAGIPSPGQSLQKGDNDLIFVDVPEAIVSTTTSEIENEIKQKYLEGLKQLAIKLSVKLPKDYQNPSGYEPFTSYAEIDGFGILPPSTQYPVNRSRIWVRVKRVKNDASPMATAAVQLLRESFPAKAFPGNNVDPSKDAATQLVRALIAMAANLDMRGFDSKARTDNMCMTTDLSKCFIRLTNPYYTKIGGGYRVKKVTIKDGWERMTEKRNAQGVVVEAGDHASEYGQIYDYSTEISTNGTKKKISSGVATYEPQIGAEENPFKEVLNYANQNPGGPTQVGFIDMPFGESFFPAPMVGYSQVRVRSIHNSTDKKLKSGVGTQETKFYTSKDFPYLSDFTDFDPTSNVRYKSDPIMKFLKIDVREMVTLSQGFRVTINDMNGKVRSQSSYPENDILNPINYTEYFYRIEKSGENSYKLNNELDVVGKNGVITKQEVGKDIEVMVDFREHKTETNSSGIQFNVDGFMVGPFPVIIPVLFKPPAHDENTFRSVSVLKVVNQYGVIDSVIQIDKGSAVSTKNLVYDSETGDVIVSRTQNEFNSLIYNTNYPAHWVYSGMEPAYKNIDVVYNNVVFRNGFIESSHVNQDLFESGDEIYVFDINNAGPSNSAACAAVTGQSILPRSSEYKIWALDIRKDTRNTTKQFVFIDRYGNPYNSAGAKIRIVRSGKRNILGASVNSITSLSNPVKSNSILFNSGDLILNASAIEFKDKWKGEQAFYVQTGYSDVTHVAPLHTNLYQNPTATAFVGLDRRNGKVKGEYYAYNPAFFKARGWDDFNRKWFATTRDYGAKSWALYNLDEITTTKVVVSAKLSLQSHNNIGNATHYLSGFGAHSHVSYNPHSSWGTNLNSFTIKRLLRPWQGNSQGNWRSVYENSYFDPYGVIQNSTLPVGVRNDQSFIKTTSRDDRLDLTVMVKQMIVDRQDKGFATAIQLELRPKSRPFEETRVCFTAQPKLEVKYYDPAEAYGLPGNPASPPPGQAVYSWITREWTSNCISVFTKDFMNPYCHGILGNWRSNRSYVFYGDRNQSDPTANTNIKTDGGIKDFVPYWLFSSGTLVKSNNANWVWNSEITQVNRKGLEIENHDPLDRFNAGLYGYNDNLPIAVVNNSQYRESAFDGFEDYDYKDKICAGECKTERENWSRHLKWTSFNNNVIDKTTSHSGSSSLKINAGSSVQTSQPVNSQNSGTIPDMFINIARNSTVTTTITPKGTGLTATYYNTANFTSPILSRVESSQWLQFGNISGHCSTATLPAQITKCDNLSVIWNGSLQADEAGYYYFRFSYNDFVEFYYKNSAGVKTKLNYVSTSGSDDRVSTTEYLYFNKGEIKPIEIRYQQYGGRGNFTWWWATQALNQLTYVPYTNLYSYETTTPPPNVVTTQTYQCTRPLKVQAIQDAMIDQFSLIPGKKMVLSGWVKESTAAQVSSYQHNSIKISFNGNGSNQAVFTPTGGVIEGWQRYECVFTVPSNATSIQVALENNHNDAVYFDDIRIHPFNANMKSFVYHPVNLRLMAELDENNYASYYEYDDDGTLTRVKKETRLGVKTIKETRSAIQRNIQTIQ